jgi:transcriptional regulator with XRE-family HTH domain
MVIHDRLREERARLGLHQKDVASLVGMTPRAQLMYEAGDRHPDSKYLAALAANGFDVLYILTGQRTPKAVLSAEETALLDNYNNSTDQGKAAARAVLEAVSVKKQKAA